RMPRGAEDSARRLSRFRTRALLGSERQTVHRTRQQSRNRDRAATAGGLRTPSHGRRNMKAAATDIQLHSVANAYDRWAPVYDLTFGAVFRYGRSASIQAAERIGGRILEVGVGTGISLPQYSRRNKIFGVDISEEMLRKAHKRVDELGLEHVEGLE